MRVYIINQQRCSRVCVVISRGQRPSEITTQTREPKLLIGDIHTLKHDLFPFNNEKYFVQIQIIVK